MASADLFRKLGLFVRREFLSPDECLQLKEELRSSGDRDAGWVLHRGQLVVDEMARRASEVRVSEEMTAEVVARFDAVKLELAAHFGTALTSFREPRYMAYDPSGHFAFHRDRTGEPGEPAEVSVRQVTAVVFVNDWDEFCGGALQFYARDLDGGLPEAKISLDPEAGTLIGFDPRLRHQVEAVRSGTRFTIVTWFV
jgi:predicted 2-oxoglutarate/Fe(II)-dependent dioxygenase YbiX